jgi:thiol:disulfide interchange protein DsbC
MSLFMRKITAIIVAAALWPALASAEEATDPRADIAAMIPGLAPEDVRKAPMDGLYEVAMGSQIVYVSDDRKYLFKGDIIDLSTNESITEKRRGGLRLAEVNQLGDDDMVIFGPADAKHTITVFTDVDCTYCRKLHKEMAQLNASSIRVRYVFFPRFGPGSESWAKAEAVWCSEDRQSAMTAAKNGEEVVAASCTTPVAEHYSLGNKVGVRGTPALMMEDGELFPGYVPAADLAEFLEQS